MKKPVVHAPDSAMPNMALDAEAGRVLRAKYMDWCSARLAERFVRLTPDEIYELAERAQKQKEPDGSAANGAETPAAELSYRSVVERVTEVLTAELQLPSFEEWAVAYEEAPERFDHDLAGFWREHG